MMFVLAISSFAFGQNTIELSFTADNNGQYVHMDSIYVKNLTQKIQVIILNKLL
jgi:hypothetical protein